MHYQSKQDLASAYFPDNSRETASKRFAHEIHSWYACEHRLNQSTAVSNVIKEASILRSLR